MKHFNLKLYVFTCSLTVLVCTYKKYIKKLRNAIRVHVDHAYMPK